jgi:hypothetical protein
MDYRQRILAVVILTLVITLSVGFVTEYARQSITFFWAIDEGDEFIFDVMVKGNTTTGSTVLPPLFAEMNNTRISLEIFSLPNVSVIFYGESFIENVVEHLKISSSFMNGSAIPTEYRFTINTHVSNCFLPIGGWSHLDSLFPNEVDRTINESESYLSAHQRSSFFFGYSSIAAYDSHEWHGIVDLETGVPSIVSFLIYREGQPWSYYYNVTMSLVM